MARIASTSCLNLTCRAVSGIFTPTTAGRCLHFGRRKMEASSGYSVVERVPRRVHGFQPVRRRWRSSPSVMMTPASLECVPCSVPAAGTGHIEMPMVTVSTPHGSRAPDSPCRISASDTPRQGRTDGRLRPATGASSFIYRRATPAPTVLEQLSSTSHPHVEMCVHMKAYPIDGVLLDR